MSDELTEDEYVDLRRYEDGQPTWSEQRPGESLIRRNLVRHVKGTGPGFYAITGYGRALLKRFQRAHGTP